MDEDRRWSHGSTIFAYGGEMGRLMGGHDWSGSELGEPAHWPAALKAPVSLLLGSPQPMCLMWGDERIFLYNDAYAPFLGARHPSALGRAAQSVWPEVWNFIGPLAEQAMAGQPTSREDLHLVMERNGRPEDTWWTFAYSPVRDELGNVLGVLNICSDSTAKITAQRDAAAERDRSRNVLEHMDEAFVLLDRDFRIVDLNAEATRLEQRPKEAVLGKTHWDVHPDAALEVGELYRRAMSERRSESLEHRYRWPDGRDSWIDMRAYPVGDRLAVFYKDITERKLVEAALAESEARFRNMADHAPVMMWVTDPNGRCTYLNARWYQYTGQAPGAGEEYGWLDAVHPEDRPIAEEAFVSANTERRNYRVDFRLRRADGVYRWTIDAAAARFSPAGDFLGYVGSVIDIDERKEMEAALKAQAAEALAEKRLFAEIVEATDALVLVIDPKFRILAINDSARRVYENLFGAPFLAGESLLDLLAHQPAERDAASELWGRALTGERFMTTTWWADGTPYRRAFEMLFRPLVDASGQSIGAFMFGQDVTDQLLEQDRLAAAEIARHEADALYRAYFENTAEALFVVNVLSDGGFTVEDLNPAHQASMGLSLAEVRGKRLDEILPPELSVPVCDHYRRVLASGRVYQYRDVFDLNGKPTHWDTVLVPVFNDENRIVRLIGSSRDLSRQVAAEEQLRQSQKMDAMGQLTGGVAHDFNNLLTPIVGSLDMLIRRGIGNERERRLIDGAMQSAERAKTLVQRLLAFARRQPLHMGAVDIAQLATEMAGLIESTIGPTVELRVELADGLPAARADANQLEMALLNLAVNARDAMPDGGELTISAVSETVGASHRSQLKVGQYVRLSIADTGIGMDAETARRAIEPFFSTKGIGKGTGLGLSMVHGLAAQLEGGLVISSEPGRGTTVELWLPISAEQPVRSTEQGEPVPIIKTRASVLLVDDEELVRLSTADMLTDLGYEVLEANSAEDAWHLLQSGATPDVLVTDHLMPGMSGVDLARKALTLSPSLPILIISGYAELDDVAPDMPRLAKPFRKTELAERLSAVAGAGPS